MPTPQILADIVRLLIQLLPAMALVCLVLAGIALRLEGGSTFLIGGGFTKWILWGIIMLTLPQLLLWFSFFGLPVPSTAGAIGTSWLAGIRNDVSTFINDFIIGRLTIVVAAYFVVRAVLDAAHGDHPLASVLTAMFFLAIPTTANLISNLQTGDAVCRSRCSGRALELSRRANHAGSRRFGGHWLDFQFRDSPSGDAADSRGARVS